MAKKDVEKLISLICQGGQIAVRDGFLMVTPPALAARFADRIRKLKPEILLALGHCPICAAELVVETGQISINGWPENTQTGRHTVCPTPGHYDKWKFGRREKVGGTDSNDGNGSGHADDTHTDSI